MITALEGILAGKGLSWADVQVGGVTLRANVPESSISNLGMIGDNLKLFTSLQVRDDGIFLYGFASEDHRQAFETLIGVSGIGPRLALGILSSLSTEELAHAIISGDSGVFKPVPGVGTKTASRIVLELKDKIDWEPSSDYKPADNEDLIEALTALGYTLQEARNAADSLTDASSKSLEEKVILSLQSMDG